MSGMKCLLLWCIGLCCLIGSGCTETSPNAANEPESFHQSIVKAIRSDIYEMPVASVADSALQMLYHQNEYGAYWIDKDGWNYIGNQLYSTIENAAYYGLFPNDYYYDSLRQLRAALQQDTSRQQSSAWSKAELWMSNALLGIVRDIHWGRLPYDTINLRADTVITASFLQEVFRDIVSSKNIHGKIQSLEPSYKGYEQLKIALKHFLDSVGNIGTYEYLEWPVKDSAAFYRSLYKRLIQERVIYDTITPVNYIDEKVLQNAIYTYQHRRELEPDGKLSKKMIQLLNDSNWEKFIRIAITLDKHKHFPRQMPSSYVMVNIPAFLMKVVDEDTVAFQSRVIVGQPITRTPVLNSAISNYITYPQWTVPYSIVFGEMIPKIIRDPGYLDKENLMVLDWADNVIDPDSVDWVNAKRTNFPYVIRQKEGDENSLGIMKFNFANKYSVYLHDTNARWLFSRADRALSHGCIRVQEFMRLADFLIKDYRNKVSPDSVRGLLATQTKKVISGFPRVPVYIRYFTCEEKNGRVVFYNDLYGDDKQLRDAYFATKMAH